MASTAKNVVVIQDASKILNLRVFHWLINGLSLKPEDMVTLVVILHEIYTPMGHKMAVDNRTLVGVNQRIIEKELAKKQEEYLNNEELAEIAKHYASNKVAFKIKLFTGSPPRDVALEVALNLNATWVILDRQMKKDEEFFLQMLSCGISILRHNNQIERLRGPLDLPDEIQCNSHEIYDASLPSVPYKDLYDIEVFAKSRIKGDEKNQIKSRPNEEEGCSNITTNVNETEDKIERDEQWQDQEQIQSMRRETEGETTTVVKTDQTTAPETADQPNQDEEKTNNFHGEKRDLRNPKKSEELIDQPIDDPPSRSQAQTLSISHEAILDGEQEKSNLENSVCTFCSVCKTRRPNIEQQREFTYEELQAATEAFSLKNCLSESGHLFTFRGQLEEGLKVVVKQHDITDTQVREKMKSEIQIILKARHNNVIMLLGSSTAEGSLLTAYEYACNGSLDKHLSKESSRQLTWIERKRVAIGLARGLKYLHDINIVHCNIKPSNILLTHDFKPLLGDFGFGKEFRLKSYKIKNKGNYEYIAPEYLEKGKLSTKMDVYSFGVVILELITGRRTTDMLSEDKSLVEWAKPLLKGKKYAQLVDPIIRNSYEEDPLRWLLQVTTQCLKKNPKERLSMKVVVSSLQGITDSELCHMTEDITPAISDSRIVPYINASQGPTTTKEDQPSQKEEQIESRFHGEEKKLRLKVENNQFYMIGQRNSDELSQIEEQMQNRPQGEERGSGKMIINDHAMDQTAVDEVSEFEEQMPSTLYREDITTQKISINHMIGETKGGQLSQDQEKGLIQEPISGMIDQTRADQPVKDETQMQRSSHENLLDGHQSEAILENSKSSKCSICKSRRPNIEWPKDFTYDELLEATKGFSTENSLSESEDGPTFKGMLGRQVKVVVKKYQITASHEEKILKSEVQMLISARHKNVVMLLGLCTNTSQLMIVYEQVCNGSLDQYLTRGSFQSLTWKQRLKVAMGTARGLTYLHGNNMIHGNIKPSNILLTHDFEPLIGDFGFKKVKLEPKKSSKDKSVRNSGYAAPEYLENGKLSNKADVYSFGVVLLELITGRRANDKLPSGKNLVGWARPLLGGKKYAQLVDLKISNSYEDEKLLLLVQVTEQCLRKNPKERFTMNMVVSALQGIAESPECCVIEDSSPENSYLPHDEPAMISTQGGA
ncbi:Proline-rich receptor-like protein kinase PERK3, partial [Mucuna pruriens]